MPEDKSDKRDEVSFARLIIRGVIFHLLLIAILFISAGRLNYWQGWVFVASNVVLILVAFLLFVDKKELVRERMRPGPGTKWWDKVFYVFFIPTFLAIMIVASLDAGRFGWTSRLPAFLYMIGYVAYVFSNAVTFWAMWTNRFFSSVVRIQTERGHEVVQDGPYRFVRHPGYVAGIILAISISLVLGSLWALIPAGLFVIQLLIRTYLEDRTLHEELSGYDDYAAKVRYRLLPGIW